MNATLPLRSKTIQTNEPRWINPTLKKLIRRQRALFQGNMPLFRLLRNRVNRERKVCRSKYYENNVAQLKQSKPSRWWSEVKKLSGMSSAINDTSSLVKSLQQLCKSSDNLKIANTVNATFLSPMESLHHLPTNFEPPCESPIRLSPLTLFSKKNLY